MLDEQQFHANLSLWSSSNPQMSVLLPYVNADHLNFCKTKIGELNLQTTHSGKNHFYHSTVHAAKQSHDWFKKLQLKNKRVLYVYGIGLGYAYDAIKEWLHQDSDRRLVFLEDDPAVVYCFFQTERAFHVLSDYQVKLILFDDAEKSKALSDLYWETLSVDMLVTSLPYYARAKKGPFEALRFRLPYDAALRKTTVNDYLSYGTPYFLNFYSNLLYLPGAFHGSGLFGQFKNTPAIICGAGPSLTKQLPLLAQLKEKALIFAGGSALNALAVANFAPHFGAGIDPNQEQHKRLLQTQHVDVPFFYRNRMYHSALRLVKGPRLYILGGGGYETARWFEKKLHIRDDEVTEDLSEGYNIVNFCLEIARFLGCNPIIFVGLDLAYTGLQSYADGVLEKTSVKKHKKTEGMILRKDIYGKPVYTEWKWVAESVWISEFSEEHPDLKFVNATEGGIGIKGVPNRSFESVVEDYFLKEENLQEKVADIITGAALPDIKREQIVHLMQTFSLSLVKCRENLQILLDDLKMAKERCTSSQKVPVYEQSGAAVLAEYELAEEPGHLYLLEIFNTVYSKILNPELNKILQSPLSDYEKMIKKFDLNSKRLSFLHDVASANILMIKHAINS